MNGYWVDMVIQSITAHSHDLSEIGAFGGTGELHLLFLDSVGQRARGTSNPVLCFENRERRVGRREGS